MFFFSGWQQRWQCQLTVLILLLNVLLLIALSITISQPSKLSLVRILYVFTRSCFAWSYTSTVISMEAPSSAKSSSAVYQSCSCIQPTFFASKEWVAEKSIKICFYIFGVSSFMCERFLIRYCGHLICWRAMYSIPASHIRSFTSWSANQLLCFYVQQSFCFWCESFHSYTITLRIIIIGISCHPWMTRLSTRKQNSIKAKLIHLTKVMPFLLFFKWHKNSTY